MTKLPEPPRYEETVNEKPIYMQIYEKIESDIRYIIRYFIFLKLFVFLKLSYVFSKAGKSKVRIKKSICGFFISFEESVLGIYKSAFAISKKAETKRVIYTSVLLLITYFLLSGLWTGATGGGTANGGACAYDAQCVNLCDNQTAIGLASDNLICFSAAACLGSSNYCGGHDGDCQVEAGADSTCDDRAENTCLTDSYCNNNCAYKTLTAPTTLKVRINQSYLKNTRQAGLNLSWTDASNGESSFEIYRSTDNSTFTQQVNYTASPYMDDILNDNSIYFYKVRAVDSGSMCEGSYSNTYHNITADRTGPAPPNVILKNYTNKIELNWTHTELGLSLYLPFEEPSGTSAEDWSNKTNRAVLVNTPTRVTGRFDSGIYFNGGTSSNYVNVSDSNSLDLRNKGTMMFWFRRNSTRNYQMYLTKGDGSNPGGYQMMDSGTSNRIVCRWGQDSDSLTSSQTVANKVWTHVACVYNGTTLRLYINGYLDKTVAHTTDATANSIPLRIGARSDGYYYNGSIDEVWVYNRSLSQREVIDNMQSGLIKKRIYRATAAAGPYTALGNFSSNNYTDSAATDTADPGEVRSLTSSSHFTSGWSNDTTVDLTWSGAVDAGTRYFYNISSTDWYGNHNDSAIKNITVNSTLDGYDILCDTSSGELATTTKDYEESQTTHTCTFTSGSSNYFHIKSKDVAGNWDDTSADIGPFYIDNSHPSMCNVSSINESTKYAYATGKTIYYNSVSSGYFTVRVNATDAVSGISNVTYSATTSAGTIDTASAYRHTYDWDTSDAYSSTSTLTCKDKARNSNSTTFVVTRDVTAPSGGSVSYTNGYTTSTSITFSDGSDSGAGINTSNTKLLRRTAALLSNNSCGTFGSWSQIGSNDPTSPYSDTLTGTNCYEYKYHVFDNVWNNFNYTSSNQLIYNNLPTHNNPAITPTSPNSTSNLTCTPQSVADSDGNKVINITNWYKNGKPITVLNMPFEGHAGNEEKNTTDYSGYGNNGTVFGATWNRTGGKIGGAYLLDGTNDQITVADSLNLDITGSFSVSAWIRLEELPTASRAVSIISKGDFTSEAAGSNSNYAIFIDNGISGSNICISGGYESSTGTDRYATWCNSGMLINKWYHVVAVHDSDIDTVRIYVNGTSRQELTGATEAPDTGSQSIEIGDNLDNAGGIGQYLNGTVDEVMIFNYSLSPEQIWANYQVGLANKTSRVIVRNETSASEQWKCSVIPNDGYQDGTAKNSTSVTIQNSPPSVPTNITCDGGYCNSTFIGSVELMCYGSTDINSDAINYVIYKGNETPLCVGSANSCSSYPNSTSCGYDSGCSWGVGSTSSVTEDWTPSTDYSPYQGQNSGWYIPTSTTLCVDDANDNCLCYDENTASATDNTTKQSDLDLSNCYPGTANVTIGKLENAGTLEATDCIMVYFSNNSGTTWGNLTTIGCDDAAYVGGSATVNIDNKYLTANFMMRFQGNQDATGGTAESMCIDNVAVSCKEYACSGTSNSCNSYTIQASCSLVGCSWDTVIDYSYVGNHTEGSSYVWDLSAEPEEIYEYLQCKAVDLSGSNAYSANYTQSVNLSISQNTLPTISKLSFNPAAAFTTNNIQCNATILDSEESTVTVEYLWYNSGSFVLGGNKTGVSVSQNTVISTLGYGNTTKGQNWNCTIRANDGSGFGNYNSSIIQIKNSPPSIPVHYTPTSANLTVHDRSPFFRWTSSDVDGDDINYTINITFPSTVQCGTKISASAINSNYTPSYDFCLDLPINWTVRAFDGYNYSSWSTKTNFTIESYISLNLSNSTINFGSLVVSQSKNTDNGSISPLRIENNGNIMVNIARIGANASLWVRQALNTEYFQFKADNDTTESRSFNWSGSITSWTNMTSIAVVNQSVVKHLDYRDGNDTAEIDLKVTVPLNEPPTNKRAQIYIVGGLS